MLSHQNEGILFISSGGVIHLEIFCFITFAFITAFWETYFSFQIKWPNENNISSKKFMYSSFRREAR